MGRKKNHDYFSMLVDGVSYACAAAEMLNEYLQDFEPEKLSHHIEEMHKIEHAADIAKHEMLQKLLKEFITTIDRCDRQPGGRVVEDVYVQHHTAQRGSAGVFRNNHQVLQRDENNDGGVP